MTAPCAGCDGHECDDGCQYPMTGVQRCQPTNAIPVCCYCDADLSCSACGREQPYDDIATLKARVAELEANEAAYESTLGKRTYNEVAEHIRTMERALQWIVNSPSAHPANMVKVAEDALSHAGPVARDGER